MLDKTIDGKYTLIGLEEKGQAFQSHLAHYHLLGTQVMVDLVFPEQLGDKSGPFTSRLDTLLTLRSPGIRRVFAWGREEDYFFVVREFTSGVLLSELLQDSGDLPAAQVLALLRSLVDGLGVLHGRGIYFLGLNPHQVWVGRDGSAGIVRPGYSYLLECDDERLSREAAQYWAPEVLAGGEGTRASDVFSLAVMAKRLLTPLRDHQPLWGMLREASAFEPSHRPPSARVFMERLEGIMKDPSGTREGNPASREKGNGPSLEPPAGPEEPKEKPGRNGPRDESGNMPSAGEGEKPEMPPVEKPAARPGRGSGHSHPFLTSPAPSSAGEPEQLSPRERLSRLIDPDIDFCAEPPRGRPGRRRLFAIGGSVVLLALAAVLAFCLVKPSGTTQPVVVTRVAGDDGSYQEQLLTMPDLRGMDSAQARRLLHEMGLEVEVVSEPSNVVPEGKVIIQEPMKGETMRKGSKVKVYVSKGPLQQQTGGTGLTDTDISVSTMREPLPGRGNAIVEPRGPGGPGEPAAGCPERRDHGV